MTALKFLAGWAALSVPVAIAAGRFLAAAERRAARLRIDLDSEKHLDAWEAELADLDPINDLFPDGN